MKHVCETYKRCNRCVKINAKLRAKYYQRYREYLWKELDRHPDGRLLLTPGQVNTLMHKRLAVGRDTRRWKRGQAEEVGKQLDVANTRIRFLECVKESLIESAQRLSKACDIFEANSAQCVDEYEKRLTLQTTAVKLIGLFNLHHPEWSDPKQQLTRVDWDFHSAMKDLEKLSKPESPPDDRPKAPGEVKSLENT